MCLLLSEAFVREAKHLWEFSRKSRQEDICLSFFGPIPLDSPAQQISLTRKRVYHEIKSEKQPTRVGVSIKIRSVKALTHRMH